jgi:metallophosphoesterase superfamily enzyme
LTRAGVGDVVVIHGHRQGEPQRLGEILEVLGEAGHEHFRVRWDDDRESVFYPGSDAAIRPRTKRRR